MPIDGLGGWLVIGLLLVVFCTYPAAQPWIAVTALVLCGCLFSALAQVQEENDELRRNQRP